MNLVLPLPPSANRLWRRAGRSIHRSDAYQAWQERALWALREQVGVQVAIGAEAAVAIDLVGRTGIDVDNAIKPTLDLLEHAGVLANDRLVAELRVRRLRTDEPGRLEVFVGPLAGAFQPEEA